MRIELPSCVLHLIRTEDILHMLIKPLQLIANTELEILRHLDDLIAHKRSFILNPLGRAHRRSLDSCTRHLCVVLLFQLDQFRPSITATNTRPKEDLLATHVSKSVSRAEIAVRLVRSGRGRIRRVC